MSATETNCKYLERIFDSLEMFYFTLINFSIMFVRSASGHDLHLYNLNLNCVKLLSLKMAAAESFFICFATVNKLSRKLGLRVSRAKAKAVLQF